MRKITVLGLALAGCEEATPCEATKLVDKPELVIGLGEEAFEREVQDGEHLAPEYGEQGGQHLWLAVRTHGFAPGEPGGLFQDDQDVPVFVAELEGVDSGEIYASQSWGFFAMDGDTGEAEIAFGTFVVSGMSGEAYQQDLILRVTGTDVCGNELVGERIITIEGGGYSTYGY
jgi:hypothetical protein